MKRRHIFVAGILLGGVVIVGAVLLFWIGARPVEQSGQEEAVVAPTVAVAASTVVAVASSIPAATATATTAATLTATPVPPPIVETATPAFIVHVVAAGETIYQLSRRYEISPTTILEANELANPDRLEVGQQLLIPNLAPPAVEEAAVAAVTSATVDVPPSPSREPTPMATPTAPAPAPPSDAPITINGISREWVAYMPEEVLANSREIFARGQEMGRNPRAFSKLGDSVIQPPFLKPYDVGNYDLGIYSYLEGVVDYFAGSYGRDSASLRIGLHSWTAFDPIWADKSRCEPNEGALPCELRLHNPSILIIRLGSNDVGVGDLYATEMRRIVEYTIEQGVIPVLGTKADRNEGSDYNNTVVRQLAAEYQVPLWDFDWVADTVPNRGLGDDGVHLDGNGHFMQNVSALVMLDRLWREVIYGPRS